MEQTQQPKQPQPINTVEEMGTLVLSWFENRHQQVNHVLTLPDSEALEVEDKDSGDVITLTDEQRKIFLMGIAVGQTFFSEPPFKLAEAPDAEQPTA